MGRYRSGYVRVDVSEVIHEIEDDILLEEVHTRKLIPESVQFDAWDDVSNAYQELRCGRTSTALSILDRLLNPKWATVKACGAAYAERQRAAEK